MSDLLDIFDLTNTSLFEKLLLAGWTLGIAGIVGSLITYYVRAFLL